MVAVDFQIDFRAKINANNVGPFDFEAIFYSSIEIKRVFEVS